MRAKIGLKGHSRHPVPIVLVIKTGERDEVAFHGRNCLAGNIVTFNCKQLMSSLDLTHRFKLDTYGV